MHGLRTHSPAIPFEWDERLKCNGLGAVEAGIILRKRTGLPEAKSEGAIIAPLFILAAARTAHHGDTIVRYSGNAAKYPGLTNVFGSQATYHNTSKLLSVLNDLNIVETQKGTVYGHVRGLGQSTFRGDDTLCEKTIGFEQEFVKSAEVRMREANGAYSAPPRGNDYDRHKGEISDLNSSISALKLNFANCGQIKGKILHTPTGAILQKPTYIHRTFEGEYDRGGTIGCRTYQDMKKAERKLILMDGDEVVELEFEHLLAFQAYQKAGIAKSKNPYSVEFFDESLVVAAFEACLDAPDFRAAINIVKSKSYLDDVEATSLLVSLTSQHIALKDVFYSEIGPELRNKESNMMIDIASTLFTAGIGCLPLRSSVIVPKAHEILARDLMLQCFNKAFPASKIELRTD